MLGHCEMTLALACHLGVKIDEDPTQVTNAMASRTKAASSKLAREVVALARESMGGNGILLEYGVMKYFADMEALYTYEGTYDINSLVSGREITGGLSAFV
jgi:glutaryl-CoA dehydrogenase